MGKGLGKNARKNIFVAAMLFIPVVHFIIFWGVVNFNSILLAFKRFDISSGTEYFTLQNFAGIANLFGKYGQLTDAIQNTLITWAFGFFFILPWSFMLTYFLYKKIRLSSVWRTVLFIPMLLPAVAMTSIFIDILLPNAPVGKIIQLFGGTPPGFFVDEKIARWTIIFYIFLTSFGGQFVLFSGAMSRVPKELIESAYLDGAGMRVEIFKIIIPLCWPTISMLMLLNISGLFTASGPVLLLTGGDGRTSTLAYYFFAQVRWGTLYEPAAVGLMFTCILFPIVLVTRWGLNKFYADVEF